ncbi:MAG: hypothetical protein BWK80_51495 [Desulfobacteraceae bacterium IS3]|nr:MAG: hypothetical protein BWK80_51495 [Desulfobacteraceae bacterium IS3]
MAEKQTFLYLESTIPSYLASLPSRDLIAAAHQQITHEWWLKARSYFEIYVSEAVLEEIRRGDPDAAVRRLAFVEKIPILALTDDVKSVADTYYKELGLPSKARLDVIHIAYAVVYESDYLLTWNCNHIANGVVIRKLQALNRTLGHKTPVIVTPEELLTFP